MSELKSGIVVTITACVDQDGEPTYIVADAESEFARSSTITGALRYVSDLLYGPGTGPRGFVWTAMEGVERSIALSRERRD